MRDLENLDYEMFYEDIQAQRYRTAEERFEWGRSERVQGNGRQY